MNVKELRAIMCEALRQEGLDELRLIQKALKAWTLPGDDLIRFFKPHAVRYSWGFIYSGMIGVEIPSVRRPDSFPWFVGYQILNEDVFQFAVEHGKPVPTDLWAGLLKDRLEMIPESIDGLIESYRRNKEELGWLAEPTQREAWDFLLRWRDQDDGSRPPTQGIARA